MKTKEYKWLFNLKEFSMRKDAKEDYVAHPVTLKSMTVRDIAKAVANERTEYRVDTLVNIANLMDEKIRQSVCEGNTVVTGSAVYTPGVKGVFVGNDGVVNREVNRCVVHVSPSAALRAEVEKVQAEFSGNVKDFGGARIALVRDVTTDATDGHITPGGMLHISGTKIRCLNADGTAPGTMKLINNATEAVAATITLFGINNPSLVVVTVPASLSAGEYRLVMETYYSTTSTLLRAPRILEYPLPLIVGDAGGNGGDEDNDLIV